MERIEQQQPSESQIENLPESQAPQQPAAEQAEAVKGGIIIHGSVASLGDGSVRPVGSGYPLTSVQHTGGANASVTDGTSNTIMFAEKSV